MAFDRLIKNIIEKQNPTVAGLDPKLDYVPDFIKCKAFDKYGETLKGAAKAILEYNKGLIDALCGIVPAVKPQAAYYEMYGWQGMKTLYKTQEYAREKYKSGVEYRIVSETGPDHDKTFVAEVIIGDKAFEQGTGHTKKAAEQAAAYETLLKLKNK